MISGTFSIPRGRPSVSAVSRVLVREKSGSPVIAQVAQPPTGAGAAAASATALASARRRSSAGHSQTT